MLALRQGDEGRAAALHEEALALGRKVGDRAGIAASLYCPGSVALRVGDYGLAEARFEESLALCRALEDRWGVAMSLNGLGNVAH